MSGGPSDKRTLIRFPAKVAARVKTQGQAEISAVTRDLSAGGVFLYTDKRITQGSKLEVVLILPRELGFGERQWACCQASVVRVEVGKRDRFGVAATIDRLDLLPEIPM